MTKVSMRDSIRMTDRTAQVVQLSDGRELGFAEWGSFDGDLVVIDCHGGPGCRLAISADLSVVEERGARWISVDRPGLGLSFPHPDRCVADFADDIEQLAEYLAVDRFVVVGWSMGGPYAAACAALLADRVLGFGLFAPSPIGLDHADGAEGMGKAWTWQLARDDPWQMADIYTRLGLEARRNPSLALELFSTGLSPSELVLMKRPDVGAEFIATIIEATRQGAIGLVDDMRVEMQPWGFDPATIARPGITWQGDDDSFVTPADAQRWAETVPGLERVELRGDGHLFPFARTAEILDALAQFA
jgi:pimeloyl-ACP methyl ester carboxylesterase